MKAIAAQRHAGYASVARKAPCRRESTLFFFSEKARIQLRTQSTAPQLVSTPTKSDVDSAPKNPETVPATEPQQFQWFQQWYPVLVLEGLDPKIPVAVKLLGKSLVLWNDGKGGGGWHCLEDKCSHRLAPLSEGRVEAGKLMCSYHGWKFEPSGQLATVPQLEPDSPAHATACASHRSCVAAYPVQERHGLLWVLPTPGEAGQMQAAKFPVPCADLDDVTTGRAWISSKWYVRDLPLSWDVLTENVVDANHIPFAHHGVLGNRNKPRYYDTTVKGKVGLDGFACGIPAGSRPYLEFKAPGLTRYNLSAGSIVLYVVPKEPGWSRFMYVQLTVSGDDVKVPQWWTGVNMFARIFPWAEHTLSRNEVLDGDTYLLHVAERTLKSEERSWRRDYYMPAPADSSVIAVRTWMDKFGGKIPTCEAGTPLPPVMSREAVMDRWNQHTKNCSHCKKAVRNVEIALYVNAALAFLAASGLVGNFLAGTALLSIQGALGAGLLLACAAVYRTLTQLRQKFFTVEYVHALRD